MGGIQHIHNRVYCICTLLCGELIDQRKYFCAASPEMCQQVTWQLVQHMPLERMHQPSLLDTGHGLAA